MARGGHGGDRDQVHQIGDNGLEGVADTAADGVDGDHGLQGIAGERLTWAGEAVQEGPSAVPGRGAGRTGQDRRQGARDPQAQGRAGPQAPPDRPGRSQGGQARGPRQAGRGVGASAPGDDHRRRAISARPGQGPDQALSPRLRRRPLLHRQALHALSDPAAAHHRGILGDPGLAGPQPPRLLHHGGDLPPVLRGDFRRPDLLAARATAPVRQVW